MHFYIYIPNNDGSEPVGTLNKWFRDYELIKHIYPLVKNIMKHRKEAKDRGVVIQSYTNLYDKSTHEFISYCYEEEGKKEITVTKDKLWLNKTKEHET